MSEQQEGAYFVFCLRCLGHGHFVLPVHGAQFEVFSRIDAHQQLQTLVLSRRISMDQFTVLTGQVECSELSASCPPDVEEFIRSFCQSESWVTYYSQGEEDRSQQYSIDGDELALAVHEFLLESPGHALRLH